MENFNFKGTCLRFLAPNVGLVTYLLVIFYHMCLIWSKQDGGMEYSKL